MKKIEKMDKKSKNSFKKVINTLQTKLNLRFY